MLDISVNTAVIVCSAIMLRDILHQLQQLKSGDNSANQLLDRVLRELGQPEIADEWQRIFCSGEKPITYPVGR